MQKYVALAVVIFLSTAFAGCTNPFDKGNKSGLQVLTNDIPASIFLDGQLLDKAPYINKELKPGQYLLKITPEDSKLVSYETTINLRKGLLTVVTWKPGMSPELSGGVIYELEKLASDTQTELSIVSIPDGAVVSIDDEEKEFSPVLRSDIEASTHDVMVSLPSYETQNHTVNVVAGHRLNVLVKLAKNPNGDLVTTEASGSAEATSSAQTTEKTTEPQEVEADTTATAAAKVSPGASGTVTIKSTNFFQDGKEVLRVRDAIGVGGKELGFAPVGQSYEYLDETEKNWYKIDFEGDEGWVSGQYATLNE